MTCDQGYAPNSERCGNPLCHYPESRRYWTWIWAIAMHSGWLKATIARYKFKDQSRWATIFGRVVVGYLDANPAIAAHTDLIVASPTFVDGSRHTFDHTRLILERAAVESGERLPFDVGNTAAIVKTRQTEAMKTMGVADRRRIAEEQVRHALTVPDPSRVEGLSIMVFDDVFTGGWTLREVARALKLAGASEVYGLALARQPWAH